MTPADQEHERQHAMQAAVTTARFVEQKLLDFPLDEWDVKMLTMQMEAAVMWAHVSEALR